MQHRKKHLIFMFCCPIRKKPRKKLQNSRRPRPIRQIWMQRMTVDEAKAVVVQIGTCRGWTLEQVAQRRPASLKWYLYGCDQADNILKAAASVLLDNLQQKAG